MNRKDADTARRLQADPAGRAIEEAQQRIAAKLAARKDPMDALPTTSVTSSAPPVGEIQRIPANPLGSELRSIAARLLHLRTHLDDDPHDEELRRAVVRLRDLSDGATPRPPQAAGDANDPGDDAGAAHDPHGAAQALSEPHVHYEIETRFRGRWQLITAAPDLEEAREFAALSDCGDRIVRITREVIT